jgi:UDP-N-acetylglucosamine--N-acetylmuramyl-(pentapeptide) pyrophosphoryl-undecaprenol N-acetylglucosamine transferase
MDVLIAGGGTGGHLFPGLALAGELKRAEPGSRILFVGTSRGLEARAVPRAGFDLELLPVTGLRRMGFAGFVAGCARLPLALMKAITLVRRFRPQVAVSVGGYAAGPAVLAARLLGVRCVVMEQNAVPGITNRLLGCFAHRVIAALPVTGFAASKVTLLGNPVRSEMQRVREAAYEPHTPLNVLVLGGSQGAHALNDLLVKTVPLCLARKPRLEIVHQTGKLEVEQVRAGYAEAGISGARVTAFIDDMASAYAAADLVVARAGATTIAELTVCGRPAVLIPFPFAAGDHQSANARALAQAGAAIHLPQSEVTPALLAAELSQLAAQPERLRLMAKNSRRLGRPEAAQAIVQALQKEIERV